MVEKKDKKTHPKPKARDNATRKTGERKKSPSKKPMANPVDKTSVAESAPTLHSSLTDIATQRASINTLTTQLSTNAAQVVQLEAQRRQLARTGARAAQLTKLDTQIANLRDMQISLAGRLQTTNDALANLREKIAVDTSPEQLIATLDGNVPILLLPVRLETRYFNNDTELHIRIYPDQVHLNGHEPDLTESELSAGKWYWEQRWSNPGASRDAWRTLVKAFGARRSCYLVDWLEPVNLEQIGADPSPQFPQRTMKSGSWTLPIQAIALPDRWVAVGYQETTEVFRKWGAGVPDALPVSLTPDPAGVASPPPEGELPIDEGMRWTIDYDRALTQGMAITVTDADLLANHKLKNGLTRLIVFGVDWTLNSDESANLIADLIAAHRYSDGFEFLKAGTPTNNTGVIRSGLNETTDKLADLYDPESTDIGGAKGSASQLFEQALALDKLKNLGTLDQPEKRAYSLSRVPNARLSEQRTASNLLNVLWRSTLGYYLDEILNVDSDAGDSNPVISDTLLDFARVHVKNYLFPGGPLPTARIGKQPYGILPVVARNFRPGPKDSFSGHLLALLNKLRPFWERGLKTVPRVTNADTRDALDNFLLRILQNAPLASIAHFRRVFGSATAANTVGLKQYEEIQADVLFQILGPHFGWKKPPRFTELVTDPRSYNLPVPWVQETAVSETESLKPNYFGDIATTLRGKLGDDARAVLVGQENADNLLQALLALAAVEEMDFSARQLVYLHHKNIGVLESFARAPRLHISEMLFTERMEPRQNTTSVQIANIYSRAELAKVILPTVTNDLPLATYITGAIRDRKLAGISEFADLASFLSSLDALRTVPSAHIERAFRGVLDCYSYRLDAWYTSLAKRRLDEVRSGATGGLYIGGYGWVENLQPEIQPDSLGYVHAPSIPQAITAAILRSAHLSHQTDETDPGQTPFNINMNSQRVRMALNVINGVAQGQPIADLLGYRFERSLRESDIELAKFILPFRLLAPLRPNDEVVPASQSVETIAARDVVDGVKLLDRWREEKEKIFNDPHFGSDSPNVDQRGKIGKTLDELEDVLDATSDVLIAEALYQNVLGNYERSNSATAALDRQERPVAPDVVRTPRTGKAYAQRVMVLLGSDKPTAGWASANDPRAKAEPRLNAWVGSLLGNPKHIRIAARVLRERNDGKPPDVIKTLSATIDLLGLSPLSLVFTAAPGGHHRPSELEERLAMHFATHVLNGDEHTIIELLDTPPNNAPAGTIALGELRVILDWVRALISDRRAADARDLALAEELPTDGIDPGEVETRVTQVKTNITQTISSLQAAKKAETLRSALQRAAALNTPNALPRTTLSDADAMTQLKAQAQEAVNHLQRVQEEIDKAEKEIEGKQLGTFTFAQHHASIIKMVFGKNFPVLPTFLPVNASELGASLGDQAALNNNDSLALIGWLRKMGLVRPGVEALVTVLSGASLLGSSAADAASFSVMQLPHQPGQRWQALSFADGVAPVGEVSILAHTNGNIDMRKPLAGLVCDEWLELIPSASETTALSFHYDAPNARPPHLMILAVPPEPDMKNWSFQTLLDTITETFALGQLRAVGPKEIEVLGGILPAVYLPNNFTKDVPSIDLFKLRAKYLSTVVAPGVAGKEFLKGT